MLKITTILLCFAVSGIQAQSICFTYDAAGNRTLRTTCLPPIQELISSQQQTTVPVALEPGEVLVYPNPSTGTFTVRTEVYPAEAEAVIFSVNGNVVLRGKLGDGFFDLSAQPSGIYHLQITHPDHRQRTVKLEIVKD
jgi:Secretion system C-terminal sorting domain